MRSKLKFAVLMVVLFVVIILLPLYAVAGRTTHSEFNRDYPPLDVKDYKVAKMPVSEVNKPIDVKTMENFFKIKPDSENAFVELRTDSKGVYLRYWVNVVINQEDKQIVPYFYEEKLRDIPVLKKVDTSQTLLQTGAGIIRATLVFEPNKVLFWPIIAVAFVFMCIFLPIRTTVRW